MTWCGVCQREESGHVVPDWRWENYGVYLWWIDDAAYGIFPDPPGDPDDGPVGVGNGAFVCWQTMGAVNIYPWLWEWKSSFAIKGVKLDRSILIDVPVLPPANGSDGKPESAKILVNTEYDNWNVTTFHNALMHAVGHAFGLKGRPENENSIMYPEPLDFTTTKRYFDMIDALDFQKIYQTTLDNASTEILKAGSGIKQFQVLGSLVYLLQNDGAIKQFDLSKHGSWSQFSGAAAVSKISFQRTSTKWAMLKIDGNQGLWYWDASSKSWEGMDGLGSHVLDITGGRDPSKEQPVLYHYDDGSTKQLVYVKGSTKTTVWNYGDIGSSSPVEIGVADGYAVQLTSKNEIYTQKLGSNKWKKVFTPPDATKLYNLQVDSSFIYFVAIDGYDIKCLWRGGLDKVTMYPIVPNCSVYTTDGVGSTPSLWGYSDKTDDSSDPYGFYRFESRSRECVYIKDPEGDEPINLLIAHKSGCVSQINNDVWFTLPHS
ncbi:hypothetical protein ABW19_dt0203126 [Dactylella cylindrospora]|nr:hypothetical protein ABW19_dt0203126 [Dactylella cylindrospora]